MKKLSLISGLFLIISCHTSISQSDNVLNLKNDRQASRSQKVPANVTADYSCMNDGTGINEAVDFLNFMKEETINSLATEVTDEQENEYGDRYYEKMKKSDEWKFIESGEKLSALTQMMNELLNCRRDPSDLKYSMHLLDNDMVNAFTAGGHIYVTTGIIDYCETTSELACIIAHEIGHNEKGHIKLIMKQMAIAQGIAGEFGQMAVMLERMVFPSFNQKNEVEVDLYGANLAYAAGYQACRSVEVWKRMAEQEGNYNHLENFLRSHPYSVVRSDCLKKHIKNNYNLSCN